MKQRAIPILVVSLLFQVLAISFHFPVTVRAATLPLCHGHVMAPAQNYAGLNLSACNLSGAKLNGSNFSRTILTSTIFNGALLKQSNFTGANIQSGKFINAQLSDAILTSTSTQGASFAGAMMTRVRSGGVIGQASLPTGWHLVKGFLVGPGALLSGVNFANADFRGFNLTNTVLTGANLEGAKLSGATMQGVKSGRVIGLPSLPTSWMLRDGYLLGPGADLSEADLTSYDLSSANLTGANLESSSLYGANVSQTVFTSARLTGISSGGLTGSPVLPTGWFMSNGYLIGPGASLRGAELNGVDFGTTALSGVDLTGANLDGSNLARASLVGLIVNGTKHPDPWNVGGIDGIPQLPNGYILYSDNSQTFIVGRGVHLSDVVLAGEFNDLDLSGFSCENCEFWGSFQSVNLSNARFRCDNSEDSWAGMGGNFDRANLQGSQITECDLRLSLSSAQLKNAVFRDCYFGESALVGVDLSQSTIVHSISTGGLSSSLKLPAVLHLVRGYIVGPGVEVWRAPNFVSTDMHGWNLSNFTCIQCDFSNANLSGTIFAGANLVEPTFSRSNLTNANFTNATIESPILFNSQIAGTKFFGAHLSGVSSSALVGTPLSLPTGWKVINRKLVRG